MLNPSCSSSLPARGARRRRPCRPAVLALAAATVLCAASAQAPPTDGLRAGCAVHIERCERIGVGQTFTFMAVGDPPGGTFAWAVTQPRAQLEPTSGTGPEFVVTAQEPSTQVGDVSVAVTYTAPGGETCSAECTTTVVSFAIQSVTFGGTEAYAVCVDCATGTCPPYATPHWLDLDADGDPSGPGEHQSPAANVRGSTLALSEVKLDARPVDLGQNAVLVRALGPDGQTFEAYGTLFGGQVTVGGTMLAAAPLPSTVQVYDPFQLDWEVHLNNVEVFAAGSSQNRVYVTYGPPAGRRLETFFDIGTRAAAGTALAEDVIDAVWAEFTDLHVETVRGETMGYYRGILCAYYLKVYDAQGLVMYLNSQCSGWQDLMIQCLRTQGILGAEYVYISTPHPWFLVENYTWAEGHGISGCPNYPFRFDSPCTGPYWPPGTVEVADGAGLPGQDEPNPASWFQGHTMVKINGNYYDPSYGAGPIEGPKEHANLIWEDSAVSGYTGTCGIYRAARKDVPGVLETSFDR